MRLFDLAVATKLAGGSGGGGGSSDFTTATVTVVPNSFRINTSLPDLVEAGEMGEGAPAMISTFNIEITETTSYNIALYKGGAYIALDIEGSYDVDIEGDAQHFGDGIIFITGDCTITIS